MDIKDVYLNAKLKENIYMELPEGLNRKGFFCKLKKALYDWKQSGIMWNEIFNRVLISLNFKRFINDPCVCIKKR